VRALVVGAGPLGQVFAAHLQAGGCDVALLVKKGRRSTGKPTGAVYRLARGRRPRPLQLQPIAIYDDPGAASDAAWDMVWLCVQSTVLGGAWAGQLAAATGDATIVATGQGIDDISTLREIWPQTQIVQVIPSLMAYPSPLSDETSPSASIAYWIPPGSVTEVVGDGRRAADVARALQGAA